MADETAAPRRGLFTRFRTGLTRSRAGIAEPVRQVFRQARVITDDTWDELEALLIQSDMGAPLALELVGFLRDCVRAEKLTDLTQLYTRMEDELIARVRDAEDFHDEQHFDRLDVARGQQPAGAPHVTLVAGVNGAGKTTTIGKLASAWSQAGRSVVVAAADTFRAAALEQLEVWCERAGVPIVRQQRGGDPAAVCFDAWASAQARGADELIIDTAGRLQTKVNLMEELKKIVRVLQKQDPTAPHDVWLVIDATTGQNGISQAKLFTEALGVTGIILTKLDGTAKGGIVLGIQRELSIPVRYVGLGENIDDLQPFDPEVFVRALFEDDDLGHP